MWKVCISKQKLLHDFKIILFIDRRKIWEAYFAKIRRQEKSKHDYDLEENADAQCKNVKYVHQNGLPTTQKRNLNSLINYIENILHSNLRTLMVHRFEQIILKYRTDYFYWHTQSIAELNRLGKYITAQELRIYLRFWLANIEATVFNVNMNKYLSTIERSSLKKLFYQSACVKNKDLLLFYQLKIQGEWRRLSNTVPLECLVSYALKILQGSVRNVICPLILTAFHSSTSNSREPVLDSMCTVEIPFN